VLIGLHLITKDKSGDMVKKHYLIGLMIGILLLTPGCQKEEAEVADSTEIVDIETVESQYPEYNMYQDEFGGFSINVPEGWEVSDTNNLFTTLTPTEENQNQKGCIVVAFMSDYPCDNTYEVYINAVMIKDELSYSYLGETYETLSYYMEVPDEETIGDIPVMVEKPELSLVNAQKSTDKLRLEAAFFHYFGNDIDRNYMIGYIADESEVDYVDSVVREMLPRTGENRTQVFDRNQVGSLAFHQETVKTASSTFTMDVPDTWQALDLDDNGALYRATMQDGASFEDCYMLVLTAPASNPSDIVLFTTNNITKVANASMRSPTNGKIDLTVTNIFEDYEDTSFLGIGATTMKLTETINRGPLTMQLEEISAKTENSIITSLVRDDVQYLFVMGYKNGLNDNEQYIENVKALNEKLINSISF